MSLTLADRLFLAAGWCRAGWRESRRAGRPARGTARVWYGPQPVPGRDEPASGGIIKCQDLAVRFPDAGAEANILYLVSSALPPQVGWVVRCARRRGLRIVLNQNGVAYPGWFGPGWQAFNHTGAAVLRAADHVIYQSVFSRLSADRFLGPPAGGAEVLYNPVATSVFTPAAVPLPVRPLILVLAGSHGSASRVETALACVAALRAQGVDARLRVAGRLAWRRDVAAAGAEARGWARARGVEASVDWIGPYTQSQAADVLRAGHLLLHTKYNDPCPRLVVEAMACGLPVVYSATGGLPELVGAEAGIGVPGPLDWEQDHWPDPLALAAAVQTVVRDLAGYAAGARRQALARFDVTPWLVRHDAIFREVLELPCRS